MLYVKWTLIYLAIPIWYIFLIGFILWIVPDYSPTMFVIPILLALWLVIELIISTAEEEKINIK